MLIELNEVKDRKLLADIAADPLLTARVEALTGAVEEAFPDFTDEQKADVCDFAGVFIYTLVKTAEDHDFLSAMAGVVDSEYVLNIADSCAGASLAYTYKNKPADPAPVDSQPA